MTRLAILAIPTKPARRWLLFREGLKRNGYETVLPRQLARPVEPDDVLVTWNKRSSEAKLIEEALAAGAPHLVVENAYIREDEKGQRYYALALYGHNGSGITPVDDGQRWRAMGIRPAPWRDTGDWIVVAEQRGIGPPGMAMPTGWAATAATELREATGCHVEVRQPPSRAYGQPPLLAVLSRAFCCVVWTSNVATQALLMGVPAVYCGPTHVCAVAMGFGLGVVERPYHALRGNREAAFRSLACAQWTHEEIESGEAFGRLLGLRRRFS